MAEEGSTWGQSQIHRTGVQGRAPRASSSKDVEDWLGGPASVGSSSGLTSGDATHESRLLDQTNPRWEQTAG